MCGEDWGVSEESVSNFNTPRGFCIMRCFEEGVFIDPEHCQCVEACANAVGFWWEEKEAGKHG